MSDHALNVSLENLRQLAGSVFALRQPSRILPVPHQSVAANFHPVLSGEIYDPVGLGEVERLRVRPQHFPLHRIFRFQQVELAG